MITRTLLQIRKALAKRAGIDGPSGDTASTDLTADVLNDFINDAIHESHDIKVGKWADYYTAMATVAVVAGSDTYPLPADFYKLRVVWVWNGAKYQRLHSTDLEAAHDFTGSSSSTHRYRYRVTNRNLVLMPTPGAAEDCRLFYIPSATELLADSESMVFDVPLELKLLLAIAWRECLDRQNLDPSPAIAKVDAYSKMLRTSADSLDAGEPYYLNPRQSHADDDWDPDVD